MYNSIPAVGDEPVGRVTQSVHLHHHAQPLLLLIHKLLQAKKKQQAVANVFTLAANVFTQVAKH
jgi:hypothetical protein